MCERLPSSTVVHGLRCERLRSPMRPEKYAAACVSVLPPRVTGRLCQLVPSRRPESPSIGQWSRLKATSSAGETAVSRISASKTLCVRHQPIKGGQFVQRLPRSFIMPWTMYPVMKFAASAASSSSCGRIRYVSEHKLRAVALATPQAPHGGTGRALAAL